MNDVPALQTLVLVAQPGIEPEALDPDNLLLLISHRAGDVHHVEDDGVGLWEILQLVGAVAAVLPGRNDHRDLRIVSAERDLPPQRLLVGALEMPERFRAGGVDPGVLHLLRDDLFLASPFDVGKLQLLSQDLRQLIERHVDFQGVIPFSASGLVPGARLDRAGGELLADLSVALAHSALLFMAVLEMGDVDERNRNGDHVLSALADHLPLLHVLAEIRLDLPADDFLEARVILVDLQRKPLLLRVTSREDAGDKVEYVGGADLAVAVILHHSVLYQVNLLLGFLVDHR